MKTFNLSLNRFLSALTGLLLLLAGTSSAFAQTVVPLSGGMQMTCQFVNNTGGQYADNQVYVCVISSNASNQLCYLSPNGTMNPFVAGQNASSFFITLNTFTGMQFPPTMTSGRIWISLGQPMNMAINPGTPVGLAQPNLSNPSDPNINIPFDWIEFNVGGGQIFCNTTQVDMFGIPLSMGLYDAAAGGGTSFNGSMGVTQAMCAIMAEYTASVPAAFAGLETPIRIVAPIHGSFGGGGANSTYFDSYIASCWAQWSNPATPLVLTIGSGTYTGVVNGSGQLAFTTPGDPNTYYVSEPTTDDVLAGSGTLATGNPTELALEVRICAGFNRHSIDNNANLNNPATYYQNSPANYYSQFWHQHNLGGYAYGFSYDDDNNQSALLVSNNPRALMVTIGGGNCITVTPTMTSTSTVPFTSTATHTSTATNTQTNTATRTSTATVTNSETGTPTNTSTNTATNTQTNTSTHASTSTMTNTPTNTATSTSTNTMVNTSTSTSVNTQTNTVTDTVTSTATNSETNTSTTLATNTSTSTVTNTPTQTSTSTPKATSTATLTHTSTAISTATQTATLTTTATKTSTSSPTTTYSSTPSSTPIDTATWTATPSGDRFLVCKNVFNVMRDQPLCLTGSTTRYPGTLEIKIFNSIGEHIKTIASVSLTGPMEFNYTWDGTNKYGAKCASGIYIIYLTEPGQAIVARVALIH